MEFLLSNLPKRAHVLWFLVFFFSTCCKLLLLHSRELWLDETYSAYVANLPFRDLLRFTTGDVHPQLFSIVLWGWVHIAGDAQTRLRLFSVLVNICCLLAMFYLSKRVLGTEWGGFAATLFAFSPLLLVYSLEVRSYMLFMFVFVCALSVYWRAAVQEEGGNGLILVYSVLLALLFYIHYLAVFIGAGLFAYWALRPGFTRRRLSRILAAAILTLLFVSPGIPLLLSQRALKSQFDHRLQLSHSNPNTLSFASSGEDPADKRGIPSLVRGTAVMAGFYPATSRLIFLLCAIPLACALAVVMFLGVAKRDEVCRLFLILALVLLGGVIGLHLSSARYLLFLIPVLALALARVIQYWTSSVRWHRIGLAAGVALVVIYCAGFARQATRPHGKPWQNLVHGIQSRYQPGDKVVFSALYSQVPFDYFAQHQSFIPQEAGFPIDIYTWWNMQKHRGWGGPVITQSDLDRYVAGLSSSNTKTVWLVLYETYYDDPRNALLTRLSQSGQPEEVPLPADPDDPVSSQQDSHLRLIRIPLR